MGNFILVVTTLLLYSATTTSQSLNLISDKFQNDTESLELASTDYGHIFNETPDAVFQPTSPNDIKTLIQIANDDKYFGTTSPLASIAPRGQGHSVRGQAMARRGIVVNMTSLARHGNNNYNIGIKVVKENFHLGPYVDVGGEQIWIDVLRDTLKHSLSPVSWTDYLYITVGGTLSNAGISGQTFRFGPQISSVHEMDVITGKGDLVTCSRNNASELFYAVLGGLGQFGIITRARIALAPAPTRVKWVRLFYNDFLAFKKDQEKLISKNGRKEKNGVDYLEGFLLMRQGPLDLSFYPTADQLRITSLVTQSGIVYSIELAKYYDDSTQNSVDKDLQILLDQLSFVPGFGFVKDVTYEDFLNRVQSEEEKLRELQRWEIPHPWLNLFVPESQVSDFNSGVFKGILLNQSVPMGVFIIYPMNRNKWDVKMSAVIPEEDVFYTIGLLHSSSYSEWEAIDEVNKQILQFCHDAGIQAKQYLPHYEAQQDWMDHFGAKWKHFQQMKTQFDPKKILSPGQKIFSNL
ncbi:cytokinin dehydrogenase 4 [Morus notabilis]|nr:cytokinin dehydrogenase 4 [Morus notabilis]